MTSFNSRIICVFLAILFVGESALGQNDVLPYPLLTGETSKIFTVKANGLTIPVSSYKGIHYARFGQNGKAKLEIGFQQAGEVRVSPQHAFASAKDGIRLELEKPGYYVLSVGENEKLFVLADLPDVFTAQEKKDLVSVRTFNVDGSGKTLSTKEIQRAIDETSANGKILFFDAGVYKTGTLTIGSNARIYFSEGCLIDGSYDTSHYIVDKGFKEANKLRDGKAFSDNGQHMTYSRLILVEDAANVKIWGKGIINGNGAEVRNTGKPANLIRIRNSRNVLIEGVCSFDPAAWNTHILYSDSVTIRHVKLINDLNVPNTDGFDPDASSHVRIQDCFAFCSDDNVAIKTSNNSNLLRDCHDIKVEGCVFLTKKSALKVGTETKATVMRDIIFQNNYIVMADRGLVLYCYDGARFENVQFLNNYFEKGFADFEKKAIHFSIKERSGKGVIRDVLVKDCYFSSDFHSAIAINGLSKGHEVEGLVFENICLLGKKVTTVSGLNIQQNEFVGRIELKK
ncbi:glycosyl hydrolase family 28 protein [Terrimonas sp. NA20]|uniref:Glycosyl hydrolase family 28 protein n=1 Tax=Terrimonas ginsenosidimutans TaxID=2908004 RepID=A0ABS9KMI8_9BACT|nr:glycosyl hydrolase family 28 protein [Terrimonas ginsenosidimutans]MCG2613523.1 glycosyl hydrolase family 28 protein [Terrimonas ginsenosidimutans]